MNSMVMKEFPISEIANKMAAAATGVFSMSIEKLLSMVEPDAVDLDKGVNVDDIKRMIINTSISSFMGRMMPLAIKHGAVQSVGMMMEPEADDKPGVVH